MPIEDPSYYHTNPLFGSSPLPHRLLAAWTNAPESNYIPLTWNLTTLLAEGTQGRPQAFHLFSLLLHLLNSPLSFILLGRLGVKQLPTAFIVLLFALHPLRVESVAWASSIKGLLTASFALGALIIQTSPKLKARSALLISFFLLSLLSKQTLFLLPLIHYFIGSSFPQFQLKKLTYLPLTLLSILAIIAASQANAGNSLLSVNQFLDGSLAPLKALSALGHYLKLQFLPLALFPEYPANRHWALILLGIIALLPLTLLAKHILRSEKSPLALTMFASFLILLLPTLGFLTTPLEFAADRLSYPPSLFFWATFIILLNQIPLTTPWSKTTIAIPALLLLLIIPLTSRQISLWKNDLLLTTHIRHHHHHYLANLHLANKHALAGDFEKALPFAETIIQKHPHRYGAWQTFSHIHLSLGNSNTSLQALDTALSSPSPIKADLYLLRCAPLRTLGQFADAISSCEQAQAHGSDALTVHYQKALTYYAAQNTALANREIQKALSLKPNSPPVLQLKATVDAQAASRGF